VYTGWVQQNPDDCCFDAPPWPSSAANMADPSYRFSGPIGGNLPRALASGGSTLNELARQLWTIGIELGGKEWMAEWWSRR